MNLGRNLAGLSSAAILVSMCLGSVVSTAYAADLPNIVFYISDDHSQFDSSLYGDATIPTPNFEKLAADGMMLTHAFVASPSCAPSRSAMLTGLMPLRNGAQANHTYPKEGTPYLVANLQQAGYEVAAFGKVAHGKDSRNVGFDHLSLKKPIEQMRLEIQRYLKSRKGNKPLCIFVGTTNPHVPWTSTPTINPKDVALPPHVLDTPSTREHRAAYYQEIIDLDQFLGELRQIAANQLGKNTLFLHTSDHGSQWPFGKWNLYDYGTRVPLIVSWPGKIEAGTTSDAMVSAIDLLPTLIEIAGGKAPDNLDGRSFASVLLRNSNSHRDVIFTTHTGDGNKNIYPIRSIRTREWKLIRNLHPEFAHTNHSDLDRKPMAGAYWNEWASLADSNPKARHIVDRYFVRPEWELYHVAEDRWELNNLAGDPAHEKQFSKLQKQLNAWMKHQHDEGEVHHEPRLISDPESWRPDLIQPVEASR